MELQIVEEYEVNEKTLVLCMHPHIQYQTKVLELECNPFCVKESALKLIDAACLNGASTYLGRVEAVRSLTGYKHKVPVPIIPTQAMYAFPTSSPKDIEQCYWIFTKYLDRYQPLIENGKLNQEKTLLVFKDKQTFVADVPFRAVKRQIERTSLCKVICEQRGDYTTKSS